MWQDMERWIKENVKKEYGRPIAVGTGGNISKIFELAKLKPGKTMSIKKIKDLRSMISGYSIEERIYKLQMNPDRADVIVPASDSCTSVMDWAHAASILIREVGLTDGVMLYLYETYIAQKQVELNAVQEYHCYERILQMNELVPSPMA